jgi:hypothetical protein
MKVAAAATRDRAQMISSVQAASWPAPPAPLSSQMARKETFIALHFEPGDAGIETGVHVKALLARAEGVRTGHRYTPVADAFCRAGIKRVPTRSSRDFPPRQPLPPVRRPGSLAGGVACHHLRVTLEGLPRAGHGEDDRELVSERRFATCEMCVGQPSPGWRAHRR